MVATMKRWIAVLALGVVLLGSMAGWSLHVNAATLQHQGSMNSSSQITHIVPRMYCPPPPFDCLG